MVEQTRPRTGIIEETRLIGIEQAQQESFRKYVETLLRQQMLDRIGEVLDDGRRYSVWICPDYFTRRTEHHNIEVKRYAVISLLNLTDAKLGEHCDGDVFGATSDRRRPFFVEVKNTAWNVTLEERLFERQEIADSNGRSMWLWQRVK
jgi:hypothetical protein